MSSWFFHFSVMHLFKILISRGFSIKFLFPILRLLVLKLEGIWASLLKVRHMPNVQSRPKGHKMCLGNKSGHLRLPLYKHIVCHIEFHVVGWVIMSWQRPQEEKFEDEREPPRESYWRVGSKVGGLWEGDLGSRCFTTPAFNQIHHPAKINLFLVPIFLTYKRIK